MPAGTRISHASSIRAGASASGSSRVAPIAMAVHGISYAQCVCVCVCVCRDT